MKTEAKKVVRRAKNEEWNDLGRKLEADEILDKINGNK